MSRILSAVGAMGVGSGSARSAADGVGSGATEGAGAAGVGAAGGGSCPRTNRLAAATGTIARDRFRIARRMGCPGKYIEGGRRPRSRHTERGEGSLQVRGWLRKGSLAPADARDDRAA